MHLEQKKEMALLEGKASLNAAKLNSLVVQNKPNMEAIHRKINEIAKTRKAMIVKKYDHIAEMRSILSPEQRISFDLWLLDGHHGEHH